MVHVRIVRIVRIVPDSSNYNYFLRLLSFDVYRICKHLKRISSSNVELLILKKKQKTDVNKTTRIISVGSCGVCVFQLLKQIKLFDTRAFQLVSKKVSISAISRVNCSCKRCQWEIISVTIPIKTFAYREKTGRRSYLKFVLQNPLLSRFVKVDTFFEC